MLKTAFTSVARPQSFASPSCRQVKACHPLFPPPVAQSRPEGIRAYRVNEVITRVDILFNQQVHQSSRRTPSHPGADNELSGSVRSGEP